MISGGKNQTDLFRVKKNTGETDYEILSGLTGSTVATVRATHKALTLNELVDTKVSPQEDGTVQISFDNYQDDEAILDFLEAVNPPTASVSSGLPDVTFENGVKKTGSTSSSDSLVLAISYGGNNEAGTKVKVTVALGNIKRTSGAFSQKYDDYSKPTFEFVGIKAEFTLEIAAALFDATIIDATDVATAIPSILQYAGGKTKYVTKAA
jgi:hypothetical protein